MRHERLNHDPERLGAAQHQNGQSVQSPNDMQSIGDRKRRRTIDNSTPFPPPPTQTTFIAPPFRPYGSQERPVVQQHATPAPPALGHSQNMPFATLLMAAEQAHPQQHQGSYQPPGMMQMEQQCLPPMQNPMQTPQPHIGGSYDFEDSLQDLASFMENGPLSTYHFSHFISSEQPMPFFSPESFSHPPDAISSAEPAESPRLIRAPQNGDDQGSFSRFGSRLPSLQPEDQPTDKALKDEFSSGQRSIADISQDDRQKVADKLAEFAGVLPSTFQLPSRLALSRYVAGYINGFHEHLPFLHIPTMSIDTCAIELILAMAAVGAQYCFEGQKGVELFNISQTIAAQRIKQRDARLATFHRHAELQWMNAMPAPNGYGNDQTGDTPRSTSISGPLGLPSQGDDAGALLQREDLIQTAQALLLLMAMATWAKHREILREALAIQSVLATLVRDDGFKKTALPDNVDWRTWARIESCKRTKFIVFCFFNLHCIVYNIPSLILNSELDMTLPCSAIEFKAVNESRWKETRARTTTIETTFQNALSRLFSRGNGNDGSAYNSSLGNYVLVHALIQHIFFVRQVSRYRPNQGELPPEDVASIEHALRNWQIAWKRNPESSLDPLNPNGPVTFNSTALLRLAYIRLNVDIGPGRALDTRDPQQIAQAFHESPVLTRTPKLLRAVLHSAHALSIPVKIGIHLVAQTQTFNWSIQHSLCTLECAFLLSKWLEALSLPDAVPMSPDERKIATLVKTMLDETEFAVPEDVPFDSPAAMKYLSANVLRVWAKVFRGAQTWAIVDVIGTSLNIYADMLEAG